MPGRFFTAGGEVPQLHHVRLRAKDSFFLGEKDDDGKNGQVQQDGENNEVEKYFFYVFIGHQGLGRHMSKVVLNI
jgi:hypothetical protein